MKNNCDIIRDLLPLYVDGVCSQESAKLVEEHLTDCQSCRELLDKLRGEEEIIPGSPSAAPPEDGAKVLERTARTVDVYKRQVEMGIDKILAGAGAPVAHDVLLQMGGLQRFPQEGVVQQIELAGGQVVCGPPPGVDGVELFPSERVLFGHTGGGLDGLLCVVGALWHWLISSA